MSRTGPHKSPIVPPAIRLSPLPPPFTGSSSAHAAAAKSFHTPSPFSSPAKSTPASPPPPLFPGLPVSLSGWLLSPQAPSTSDARAPSPCSSGGSPVLGVPLHLGGAIPPHP